jgi:hypothetical protein
MSRAAALLALALATLSLAAAGCGLGAGEQASGVTLTVTQDFGRDAIGSREDDTVTEGDTVMRLLQRSFEVETAYGGSFVQGIEGIEGGEVRGRPVDWFYYVNGLEAGVGAASRKLDDGDRVWWDHHDWGAAMRVPAVVGSFPAPFDSLVEGKRLPVRLGCAPSADGICDEVERRLMDAGITRLARSGVTPTVGEEVLRVVVGPWTEIRRDPTLRRLEEGVDASGVFARFEAGGRRLAILDGRGGVARRLGGGAGLVAATRLGDQAPTWIVTGTDVPGATAAASALAPEALTNRFAVAVERGRPIGLPVEPAGMP